MPITRAYKTSGILGGATTNGETLVADSSTTTGLRWQGSISAGKNIAINGNFDIWQRGTTFNSTADSAYNADRWQTAINYSGGTTNVTRDTSVPNAESQYSLKVTHATANTTTISEYSQRQRVEAENVLPLLGKTVTLSFWYRSNKTGNHGYRLYPVSVTGASDTQGTFSVTAANTWEKKTITTSALFGSATAYTGSANAQALWIVLGFQTNGSGQSSVASGDYFQIAQVQLESGSVATNFMRSGGNIAGELAACQRYYEKTYSIATAPGTDTYEGHQIISGSSDGGNQVYHTPRFQVRKRANPTITTYTNDGISGQWGYNRSGASGNITASVIRISDNGALIYGNVGASYVVTTWAGHWVANAEL
jgi:hypothetical protein